MSEPALVGPVGIVGLGLVGSSLALALRQRYPGIRLLGIEVSLVTQNEAVRLRLVDEIHAAPTETISECELIVLCMPLPELEEVLTRLTPWLREHQTLTDVIGIKMPVAAVVKRLVPSIPFVGAHPMAGGTGGGVKAARADLFRKRPVALCPAAGTEVQTAKLAQMWRLVGAFPRVISAEEHDRLVATSSHLPYASALATLRVLEAVPEAAGLAGGGLRAATRQAAFSPSIMASVVAANRFAPDALRRMASELERLAHAIEDGPEELGRLAESCRRIYDQLITPRD